MSKFSLNSLSKTLSEKSGLSPVEAELFIRKMFEVCNQGLDQDKMVKMKWLGTFKVQAVKDRESINVNTGERIIIEGRDKLSFTPDNILKEIVNKPFAQFETVVVNDGVDFDAIDKKFEEEAKDEASTIVDEPVSPVVKDAQVEQEVTKVQQEAPKEEQEDTKVSSDLQSDEQASLGPSTSDEQASEVIDFLDTEAPSEPSSDVIIIGENQQKEEKSEEQPAMEKPEEQPAIEKLEESPVEAQQEEPIQETKAPFSDGRHLLIPRYMVVAASIIVVALIAGMGWFAFNYGKMAAQRDHLAMQLNEYHHTATQKPSPAKPSAQTQISQEQVLRQKAIEDSIRMAQANEAVKAAEQAEKADKGETAEATSSQSATNTKAKKQSDTKEKLAADSKVKQTAEAKPKQTAAIASKYDDDARVRTGAYRITGVAEVVTIKAGQSIENISKRYLGPGMECYVEAINGTTTVKEGQRIKIPKLELKKKKK